MNEYQDKELSMIDLKQLRIELNKRNITQTQLAKELGYTNTQSISRILKGKTKPTIQQLTRILLVSKIPLENLIHKDFQEILLGDGQERVI